MVSSLKPSPSLDSLDYQLPDGLSDAMVHEKWTVLDTEEVFAARPYVVVTRELVRTGNGKEIPDFYRVDLPAFSVCVPQTVAGDVVTLWSYKHGPGRWGLSFPAGFVGDDEDPAVACVRELAEESGYAPDALTHLGDFVDNGNQRGSRGSYYCATGCSIVSEPNSGDLERIDVRLMAPRAVDAAIRNGDITVVHHLAAWALARPHLS
jgi:ADP-ribose pyrophosphatase